MYRALFLPAILLHVLSGSAFGLERIDPVAPPGEISDETKAVFDEFFAEQICHTGI